jgi:hypothetical protein
VNSANQLTEFLKKVIVGDTFAIINNKKEEAAIFKRIQ